MITLRLEFGHLFPEEEKKTAYKYLRNVSKETLQEIIGFFALPQKTDYYNFFYNPDKKKEIQNRIEKYLFSKKERINNHSLCVISEHGILKIQELILSNKSTLLDENSLSKDTDRDEMNLFKAFLIINEDLNRDEYLSSKKNPDSHIKEVIQILISLKFADADLNMYEFYDQEINKLIYTTIYRFDKLISFLESNPKYNYLSNELLTYFKQNSIDELKEQVFNLLLFIGKYLKKKSTSFKIEKKEKSTIDFLDSLVSYNLTIDTDYISLRNYPLYRKENNVYVIINPFFILDKFTISIKFLLKEAFEKNNKKEDFFSWFNEDFSENFLMKDVLDSIFNKKYFIKKQNVKNRDNEPDYYIRHNRDIYLFEHKDILISKDVKTSRNFNKINAELKKKLLIKDNGTPVGIGQLIRHINLISQGKFQFDVEFSKEVNKKYDIYPILLISDRLLEVPGINFILNQYFLEEIKKMTNINPKLNIKDLVVIDMNTMIFTQHYLTEKDRNFKDKIECHIKKMKEKRKKINSFSYKNLVNHKLLPYSYRFGNDIFESQSVKDKFEDDIYMRCRVSK